jgi:hypothetical protein
MEMNCIDMQYDIFDMEYGGIDMEDDLMMTLSIWKMKVSIYYMLSLWWEDHPTEGTTV